MNLYWMMAEAIILFLQKVFLEALKEIKNPTVGRLIYEPVSKKLILNAKQEPQYNPIQNVGGEVGGDFIFVPKLKSLD